LILKHGLPFIVYSLFVFIVLGVVAKIIKSRRANHGKVTAKRPRLLYAALGPVLVSISFFSVVAHPVVWDCKNLFVRYYINESELLEKHIEPLSVKAVAPKSFIYIYAESLERTYFDDELFPGLVPQLANLIDQRGMSIEGIKQIPMTNWTIAGMTASQCGIPLAAFQENRNEFGLVRDFLPGVDCLGDVLGQNSYRLSYLGGADLSFGGKGTFYKTHGFTDVKGLEELREIYGPAIPVSKWGVYDDQLLDHAYHSLTDLNKSKDRYGYVLLTLDTHSPEGFPSPSCGSTAYQDGNSGLLNAVHCADSTLSEFLMKILNDPAFSDTVVVLASDHLAMANDAGLIAQSENRENLWVAFNTGVTGVVKRKGTTLDIAPTFMGLLGYKVEKFGLGVSLNKGVSTPTLLERYGEERLGDMVLSSKVALWELWTK